MKKILITILFLPLFAQAQVILTVAGTGVQGYNGDGGVATTAMLHNPRGVMLDNSGNLYICDAYRIRKVSPAYNGTITTVAGSGTSGFSGDGGPAYFAETSGVHDIAMDHHGNLYLAEAINNRIRKVTAADGIINTIAGTGIAGYNGDGIAATTAQLNSPYGIAVDDTGNVYFAERKNRRVRKIDTAGIITTIAGTGVKGFSGDGGLADTALLHNPMAVAFDKDGILYFSDSTRIRRIDPSGIITTVAGVETFGFSGDGGLATAAEITPTAIAFDTSGAMLIAESTNRRIRKVDKEGIITTIAGTGLGLFNGDGIHPLLANVGSPCGIAVNPAGEIFFGDLTNNRARMITYAWNNVKDAQGLEQWGMHISPNPCHENCTILIKTAINMTADIVVINAAGKQVWKFEAGTNHEFAIPVTHLPCGLYIVRATIDQQQFTSKLILE